MERPPISLSINPGGESPQGPGEEPHRFAAPNRPIYTPPGGPPPAAGLSREVYGLMGEANIHRMIADLYDKFFDSEIGFMFPKDPEGRVDAARRSQLFFAFLLGGPPAYQQAYGRPAMRARHLRFPIDENARAVWLRCFDEVLENATEDYNFPAEHLPGFKQFLHGFSSWMVNKEG